MKYQFFVLTIIGLSVFASFNIFAQTSASNDNQNLKPIIDYDELYHLKSVGVGLMGQIKHPGAEFNLSFPDKYFIKEKKKKKEDLRINKVRRWETFARYYYHRNHHHNVILSAGRTWQRSLKKDKFFISQADVGIARTFYTNPTFAIDKGVVTRKYFAGDFYASFNYRLGFGKHLSRKNETYRFYSYFGLMNFAPYNNLYYSRLVVGINVNKFLKK